MPTAKGHVPFDPGKHGGQHHVGFNEALEDALKNNMGDFPKGKHHVTVQFEADVEVSNPGNITGYSVTIHA